MGVPLMRLPVLTEDYNNLGDLRPGSSVWVHVYAEDRTNVGAKERKQSKESARREKKWNGETKWRGGVKDTEPH